MTVAQCREVCWESLCNPDSKRVQRDSLNRDPLESHIRMARTEACGLLLTELGSKDQREKRGLGPDS